MPLTLAPAAVYEPLPPLPPYDDETPDGPPDGAPDHAPPAEPWVARRARGDGLEVTLALAGGAALPDGPLRVSAAHRLQLVLALEALVGVPLDPPVRRDLLADDALFAPLRGGVLTLALDRADGELLFGAPIYHAWLLHQHQAARRREPATRPGRPARDP